MLPRAVDADVNHAIVRGLRRQAPEIDLVLSQDVLPEGTPDPDVLAWAAAENRLLITNDCNGYHAARPRSGRRFSGDLVYPVLNRGAGRLPIERLQGLSRPLDKTLA